VNNQRWRDRRDSRRPAGEEIRTERYHVESIDEITAKRFVIQHHYSASYPAARCRAGLYRQGNTCHELVGVAVFSVPMNQRVVPKLTNQSPNLGVELGRFVLLDDVPGNGETWFLARAFQVLQGEKSDVRAVVSYSDPVPRVSAEGVSVMPGHVGTIYQAHNARYLGRASSQVIRLDPEGRVINRRTLSKLRNGERGAGNAYDTLRRMGAPARRPLEEGRAYVKRALEEGPFRTVRHPGNHTYAWGLDRRARRMLPASTDTYPKKSDQGGRSDDRISSDFGVAQ
jgi:hypothetical protein